MPETVKVTRNQDQVSIVAECRTPLVVSEREAHETFRGLARVLYTPVPDSVIEAEIKAERERALSGVTASGLAEI